MSDDMNTTMKAMTEKDLENLKRLLQGEDPLTVGKDTNTDPRQLETLKDNFLKAQYRQIIEQEITGKKPGRNDPCPCGSGKKYKKCCLPKHEEIKKSISPDIWKQIKAEKERKEKIKSQIEAGFNLLASGEYRKAIELADKLLKKYPEDDRLYDIKVHSNIFLGNFNQAIRICRARYEVAKQEKEYFLKHGIHRDQASGEGTLSHYYSPLSWLEKYWIALKALAYDAQLPENGNEKVQKLVKKLKEADDLRKFPEKGDKGLEQRRKALEPVIRELQKIGPEAIPYLLPLTINFSWSSLFVPEILAAYPVEDAWRAMMEISMFGYSYITAACCNYLKEKGETLIPLFQEFFVKNPEFDPLKTGIIRVLGEIKSRDTFEILKKLLEHEDPYVVKAAAMSIFRQGFDEALELLEKTEERVGFIPELHKAIVQLRAKKNKTQEA